VDAREKAAQSSGKEGWVVYKKSDNHEDHVALRDGCAGREWCTAGAVSTAAQQLRQGDFHIFYSKGQPVVALRTVNGRLDEAPRGSLSGQALTPYEREVAERRLRGIPEPRAEVKKVAPAPTVTGGEAFLSDQKFLGDIQSGAIKDYSDLALFKAMAYEMRADSYGASGVPKAAREGLDKEYLARHSPVEWEALGFYHYVKAGLRATDYAGVKYVLRDFQLGTNETAKDLLQVLGALDTGANSKLPKLEYAHTAELSEGTQADSLKVVKSSLHLFPKVRVMGLQAVGSVQFRGTLFESDIDMARGVKAVTTNDKSKFAAHGGVITDVANVFNGTLLDPNYVAPTAQAQPLIAGGEAFLNEQKVYEDVKNGKLKNYPDTLLWLLQGYSPVGKHWLNDVKPPESFTKAIDNEISNRHTVGQWATLGFYKGSEGLASSRIERSVPKNAVYVVGDVEGDYPNLRVVTGVYDGYSADSAPNLEVVGDTLRARSTVFPKLAHVGVAYVSKAKQLPVLEKAVYVRDGGKSNGLIKGQWERVKNSLDGSALDVSTYKIPETQPAPSLDEAPLITGG
jgi:hypothetical protein